MTHAVLWAGGWAHPGDDIIAAMRTLTSERGISLTVVTNPSAAAESVSAGCDLLIVGACWFSMADARYNDAQRAEHGVAFDAALRNALINLRADGCGLLALHTAAICFDGADEWRDWMGGRWNWQTSWHPPPAPITVRPANGPVQLKEFVVVDELYQGLDVDAEVQLVATSKTNDPLVWVHQAGASRVGVSLLGHDRRSLTNPALDALHGQLLEWVLR